jgi:hypothetical protein
MSHEYRVKDPDDVGIPTQEVLSDAGTASTDTGDSYASDMDEHQLQLDDVLVGAEEQEQEEEHEHRHRPRAMQAARHLPHGESLWSEVRDLTKDTTASATCTAFVDAAEWYFRRADRLSKEERLSANALAENTKLVSFTKEQSTLYELGTFASTIGLLRESTVGENHRYGGEPASYSDDLLTIDRLIGLNEKRSQSHSHAVEYWGAPRRGGEAGQGAKGSTSPAPPLPIDNVVTWLRRVGPVIARIVPDAQFRSGRNIGEYMEPLLVEKRGQEKAPARVQLAVVIESTDEEGQTFRVRNHWGKQWGDNGVALVPREYLARAATEAWGMVVKPAKKAPKGGDGCR